MWLLYQAGLLLALLLAAPVLLLRRGGHYLPTLRGRLGWSLPEIGGSRPLWIHAVSVGEVAVAAALVRALPADLPILVTTVTPTGQTRARQLLGDRCALGYLPFDLTFAIRRFLDRTTPRGLVLVEGELWPLLLHHLARRRVPIRMINGRVSDRSFERMRRLRPLLGPLHRRVERFGVQTRQDHDRLAALGVPADRLSITGNLKFEIEPACPLPDLEARLRAAAGERPILIAGSTMQGEEEQVLEAWRRLGEADRRPLLVLAPRHPERCDGVTALARETGAEVVRRSALDDEPDAAPLADVVVLDTLGELASLYRLCAGAFVGGTLVPTGGHNPLEASAHGVAVAVGPSMENFREMAETYDRAGAWRRVADASELAAVWLEWLAEPQTARRLGAAGRALIDQSRGALERTLELVDPLLAEPEGDAGR